MSLFAVMLPIPTHKRITRMKQTFLQKADENLPLLIKTPITPHVPLTVLTAGDTLTIDLGNHYVGYFSFTMGYPAMYIDAPVTLVVRFCETERELEDDFASYHGSLSASWLQEDVINVDFPGEYQMPRRYAARYIKITARFASQPLSLSAFRFVAETSADMAALKPYETADAELSAIDRVSVNTLKNCMQRVFEDGPKRDRRLWIGDLRLEALANYYTFGDTALVKRCLYLFAASDRENGFLPGYVYENPVYVSGYWTIRDYSLMYVATLCDYLTHTGDETVFRDLYADARSVMEAAHRDRNEEGLAVGFDPQIFVDWCPGLEKKTAYAGIYLYTLALWCEALDTLGYSDAALYRQRLDEGRKAARKALYHEEKKAFLSSWDNDQYSVHSTAWMILGGVIEGEEAKEAMTLVMHDETSVKPNTPYMHHYAVDAMLKAGLTAESEQYIRQIWGGMVRMGADTFFEVYKPGDPDFSPYGDRMMNSMCHAWSCTATYFIRKYGLGQ